MTKKSKVYHAIGLMSGTSLDGVDLAYCSFACLNEENWTFEILQTNTISYPNHLEEQLRDCMLLTPAKLEQLDVELGLFFGKHIHAFVSENNLKPDFVASHGHTVFHQPEKGITVQIGLGSEIKRLTGLTVVNDFRSKDVKLGGQGAPLVPIGDQLLFSSFSHCLNLGGIANVSFKDEHGVRRAFDVCGCNLVLNDLATKKGQKYDAFGKIAETGNVNAELLKALLENPYYALQGAKSLGKEDVWKYDVAILERFSNQVSLDDRMRTYVKLITTQLTNVLMNTSFKDNSMEVSRQSLFVTGGGAYNAFLINELRQSVSEIGPFEVIVPNTTLVEFKEALIFAFLGVLRIEGMVNVLSSVTGASEDSCSGEIW